MANTQLSVTSPAFRNEGDIPAKYTCSGADINPPIDITGIPAEAKSLVLIIEDPDAPKGLFIHWLVWNIEPAKTIAENSIPGKVGTNDFGDTSYGGPCPPSGTHRYFFRVYALKSMLDVPAGADKNTVEQAMQSHIIAEGSLMGKYSKKRSL